MPTSPSGDSATAMASTADGNLTSTLESDAVVDRSFPRPGPIGGGSSNGALDVSFPRRDEAFSFRQQLEAQYRDALRRTAGSTFVDLEGSIVWTMEYYRYRVNGCGHLDAISRVQTQIEGRPAPPICQEFSGTSVNFPPRNEALGFRIELERIYRDLLRRSSVELFVDMEGDIVWTQEYLRYRVNGCDQNAAVQFVFDQVRGGPAQSACGTTPQPTDGIRAYIPSVTAGDAVATVVAGVRPSPVAGGPAISISGSGNLTGGVNQLTLTASQLVDRIALTLDDTGASPADRIGAAAVVDSFYMLTFNPPKSSVTLSVDLTGRAINRRLSIEVAASVGGGPFGPYGSRRVDVLPRCSYTLSPSSNSVGVNGGTFTINDATQPGCTWNLASDQSFVALSTTSGNGSGAANYSVASNSGAARGARITLSGVDGVTTRHDVSQAGTNPIPNCTYTFSAASYRPFPDGGSFRFELTTQTGCAWTLTSNQPWVTLPRTSGVGSSSIDYSVAVNTGPARTARITLTASNGATAQHDVNQDAVDALLPCGFGGDLNPRVPGGGGTFTSTVGSSCPWTATSQSPFVTIVSFTGTPDRFGGGNVRYTVDANTSTGARTGSIRLTATGGLNPGLTSAITIEQAGAAGNRVPRITSATCTFPASAGPGSTLSCPVTAVDDDPNDRLTMSAFGEGASCNWFGRPAHSPANPLTVTAGGIVPAGFRGTCTFRIFACDQLGFCSQATTPVYTWNP